MKEFFPERFTNISKLIYFEMVYTTNSKKQNSLLRTGCFQSNSQFSSCSKSIQFLILNYFSWLLFHVTGTAPELLRLLKVSTSSELYPDYFIVAYFYSISSLVSTVSEAPNSTLPFTAQHLCHLQNDMSCQWLPDDHQISGLLLNYVKVMNVFTYAEEFRGSSK